MQSGLSSNLRCYLRAILAGTQTRQQVNECVAVCHALATTMLRRKIVAAMLQAKFGYTSYADMAYDCIADLFSQDEQGGLLKLKTYFGGIDIDAADDEELLAHLRRLVASKVNQGVFHIYTELDPALGKILRNIKLAIQNVGNFSAMVRFGEVYVCPVMAESNEHLPFMEPEHLERALAAIANGNHTIPSLMSKLSLVLREQTSHCRLVSLIIVARIFRSMYSQGDLNDEATDLHDGFIIDDTRAVIRDVCYAVKKEATAKYVQRKKIPQETFDQYFTVIEQATVQSLLGENGDPRTLFQKLQALNPALTRAEYYRKHRSIVEYLASVTHERVVERLRKEH